MDQDDFDLIVADFSLPSFDGARALELARQRRREIPFIFFSGTMGEEAAIEGVRGGAADYVLKERPARLTAAVRRALQEAEAWGERRRAEETLRDREAQLRNSTNNTALSGRTDRCAGFGGESKADTETRAGAGSYSAAYRRGVTRQST